ncbi:serine-protein kinase RsbW [Bacillus sp. JCM 19046]|uniref:Serine-protein kinase RsbW n=1 Tax=Shouchella xiaoxiensis TaxID=766895 RepID=A0ABS2ST03_9BACI|nr:anti-sigma B factor RsbW [Shouchella xiaoxiensis]MBM7838627.1 serine/threonine-protein kinase RsbW [Shouchella xiaoxiensis]GAF11776.1 serine-protein kinase RsbW [Bacillus sp. JCM 19045]GAF16071.1 serine-protein kinase RsbW [Bacillus sp. JCM 19046]
MEQHDRIHIELPAKSEYVSIARLSVSGIANRLGFSYDDIEDIKIAVAEACTNVVEHAYSEDGFISLACYIYEDRIKIIVADQGKSFNIDEVESRLGPVDSKKPVGDLKEGGLGLFLITTLMDKVEINEDNGVMLVMTKYLYESGVEESVDGVSSLQSEQG